MMITASENLVTEIIGELEPYTHEDWDDEGASPITSAAIFNAVTVLERLSNVERPHVSPIVDGSIGLFWDTNGVYLDLQVLHGGAVLFKYRLPNSEEKRKCSLTASIAQLS